MTAVMIHINLVAEYGMQTIHTAQKAATSKAVVTLSLTRARAREAANLLLKLSSKYSSA